MKTTKVILVALLMAFTTIGFAQVDAQPMTKKHITLKNVQIALQDAVRVHGLYMEMHQQLKPDFLEPDKYAYWADVEYRNIVYSIKGSYDGWILFFRTKPVIGKER